MARSAHSERIVARAMPPQSVNEVGRRISPAAGCNDSQQAIVASARAAHDFDAIAVRPAPAGRLQAKLTIGQPGDVFEREADMVADAVTGKRDSQSLTENVHAGDPGLRRAPTPDAEQTESESAEAPAEAASETADQANESPAEAEGGPEQVAALLLESDDLSVLAGGDAGQQQEQGDDTLRASAETGQTPELAPGQEAGINALRGGGQPLAASMRGFFEPRLGYDLGQVRVHTGHTADELAAGVKAKAFTVGNDVVFGNGQYRPNSTGGRWLLAHELTHVLQQQSGLARLPSARQVQKTGEPRVQGGFFGKLWKGIKKGASAVWRGIKKGASAVWSGIKKGASAVWRGVKWTAGKVWSGIKAVGGWGWNVLKAGAALAWRQVVNFPGRVWRLIKHLGSGIAGVAGWLWDGLKLAWHLDFKGLGRWLVDGIVSGAAWVGRLVGKLVDLAGIGEVWDFLFQIIKFNTRSLTSTEKSEAKKTFKDSIAYWQVRVDEFSLISAIGAFFKGGGGMGVTTFHTINFNKDINATPGSADMHWLTHELTHVSQYEHAGTQYLGEAIHAQATVGYNYNGPSALWRPSTHVSPNTLGKHFREFNREQQADIAADYYYSLYGQAASGGFTPVQTDYEPVIDELRAGNV